MARPENQTTSILLLAELYQDSFFVVVTHACSVLTALPGDSICGLSSNRPTCDAWRMCHDRFVFVLLASSVFVCFVVDPTFVAGDQGHEFARSA